MGFWEKIVSEKDLIVTKRQRSKIHTTEKFLKSQKDEKLLEGWEFDKEYKKNIRLRKLKSLDEQFEDEVWMIFANLGFKNLNQDRKFEIQYDPSNESATKQIDVFAADDETVIIVECKTSEKIKKGNFKDAIEAFGGIQQGLIRAIKLKYPNRKYKFIFATKNCYLSEPDAKRLESFNILHFDENDIRYYRELGKHLGHCARFQLLGNLFAGQKIPGIDNVIPAIEGKMGGHTYYSFSIEPEKLLKIGYVLHRNNANNDLMPTYQRIIKKSRLKSVQNFVDNGGFFPNSIIINLDTNGRKLQFDFSDKHAENSIAKIGLLHLPQVYRSAYIIDGQHRLYGYADSKYASKNTLPVVAFIDLSKEEQVKLFMDINENQKMVSKNLRLTLETDLFWDSPILSNQRKALQLRIAQRLGDDKFSPLYNRVLIGENEKSVTCCITIDSIQSALSTSTFFTRYDHRNLIINNGTFDFGKNDASFNLFYPFVKNCLEYINNSLQEEWEKGESDNGILTINLGIYGLIKVLNDIVEHLVDQKQINPTSDRLDTTVDAVEKYLIPLVRFYKDISPKEREQLRKQRGSGGRSVYWRTLQQAINSELPDFLPPGLHEWIFANKRVYNDDTYKKLNEIFQFIKSDIRDKLQQKYGENWFVSGLPKAVYDRANKLASDYNYERGSTGQNKEPWDFIRLNDCRSIAVKSGNWAELFESTYAFSNNQKKRGGKMVKTEWLGRLADLQNKNFQSYSVPQSEYEFVKKMYDWQMTDQFLFYSESASAQRGIDSSQN
ncbi:DGQHR domain-containing protein [Sporolactobacillus shoreicorticis]|uniref:DGQHR domain-containing protein n=1 Tax=Sporolactobacillus shoreicorticis TaxID=1923877 RepID=A0ABW5S8S9_9BACL|nr:DGQHR domain-containing protein [Sporolactobacillus shoreicorticis]MCO7126119.1 DGQHR domain-containing protein [Sporolactobacillus shoreicorticis]